MSSDEENSNKNDSVFKRLSVNTRLSSAHIFEEDSNDSKRSGKIRTAKKNNKGLPYKPNASSKKNIEYENDQEVLQRRQKQIDYGKNTLGYDNYIATVPINKRNKECPKTPNKYLKYSRRGWDCLVKIWRMKLHEYDPKNEDKQNDGSDSSSEDSDSDKKPELSLEKHI